MVYLEKNPKRISLIVSVLASVDIKPNLIPIPIFAIASQAFNLLAWNSAQT